MSYKLDMYFCRLAAACIVVSAVTGYALGSDTGAVTTWKTVSALAFAYGAFAWREAYAAAGIE